MTASMTGSRTAVSAPQRTMKLAPAPAPRSVASAVKIRGSHRAECDGLFDVLADQGSVGVEVPHRLDDDGLGLVGIVDRNAGVQAHTVPTPTQLGVGRHEDRLSGHDVELAGHCGARGTDRWLRGRSRVDLRCAGDEQQGTDRGQQPARTRQTETRHVGSIAPRPVSSGRAGAGMAVE